MNQSHTIISNAGGRYILAARGAVLARLWMSAEGAGVVALWDYDTDKDATHPEALRVIKEDDRILTITAAEDVRQFLEIVGEYFPHVTMREFIARQ